MKAINQEDGKDMKVLCILAFTELSEFVEILIGNLKKYLQDIYFCNIYTILFWKKGFSFSSNGPTSHLMHGNNYILIL